MRRLTIGTILTHIFPVKISRKTEFPLNSFLLQRLSFLILRQPVREKVGYMKKRKAEIIMSWLWLKNSQKRKPQLSEYTYVH